MYSVTWQQFPIKNISERI